MFEWLEAKLAEVKTPRFHVVDGAAEKRLRDSIVNTTLPLPSSYKDFAIKIGNAKLYRDSRTGYRIGIFAGSREESLKNGTKIYKIGFHDGADVYTKPGSNAAGFPIYEVELASRQKVANNFEDWLQASCAPARKTYGRKKWEEILRGPEPFSQ